MGLGGFERERLGPGVIARARGERGRKELDHSKSEEAVPTDDAQKENKQDGQSLLDKGKILVNPQKPKSYRRDSELHCEKSPVPLRDQSTHEGIELNPSPAEMDESHEGIQDLEEKDGHDEHPDRSPEVVHVVVAAIAASPVAAAAASQNGVAAERWSRPRTAIRFGSLLNVQHYMASIVDFSLSGNLLGTVIRVAYV